MEHIPRVRVVDTLAAISARTRRAAYFRIATRPDRMGALIGETLHLTVEAASWWRLQLGAHFRVVDLIEATDRDAIFLARP